MNKTNLFVTLAAMFVVLIVVLAAGWWCTQAHPPASASNGGENASQRTITVSGRASVVATPDIAYITLGIRTKDKRAQAALAANNAQAAQVYQTLAQYGIEKKDIRTLTISLSQREERDRDGKVLNRYYVAENIVQVTVRELDKVGQVLDAVVQSGANQLQGIRFDVSDRAALLEQARLEAVKQGRAQAEALAEAAGARLGEVQRISFQSIAEPVQRDMVMMEAVPKVSSVPVSGGQMEVQATVQMVFTLVSP